MFDNYLNNPEKKVFKIIKFQLIRRKVRIEITGH